MTDVSRKDFIVSAASLATFFGLKAANGEFPRPMKAFKAGDYQPLRKMLRAFYPDECHRACKDVRQVASMAAIGRDLDDYAVSHPAYDALDMRRECYLSVRRHFLPFVFTESPYYFEAGVNGGWTLWEHDGQVGVPGRHVNRLCRRFYKEQNLIPDEAFARYREFHQNTFLYCCGPFSDDMHHVPPFRTILEKGFSGVRREVEAALAVCPKEDPLGRKELETALVGLDTLHEMQLKFGDEARRLLERRDLTAVQRRNMERIVESAARCPWEPPRSFYEGLNTLWFVRESLGYIDGVCNFSLGRPDAWFIDAYRRDIASGLMTEDEARDLVARFLVISDCHLDDRGWKVDASADQEAEMPLTLGGCDAQGRPVWNELTEMFLDAHLECDCLYPKLHCRISADSPSAYLRKIGEMLMADHAVFALFNDDRHIPQFVNVGFPIEQARDYVGTGCWDGNVDSWTDVDCANYISVLRTLVLTIKRDPGLEKRLGLQIDPIDDAKDFDEVLTTIYRNFIRFYRGVLADYTRYGRANAKIFPHPVYSMCIKGGVETRRDTTDGGIFYRPREVTLAFMANVVDSLCAIRKLCFEDRSVSLGALLNAVRSNWSGVEGERIRTLALSAPYWGDDSKASNSMMKWWIDSISRDIEGFRNDQGGPYVLATWIYREFIYWGRKVSATPDGRHDGDQLAQGFAPSEFRCKSGITTVFNAIGSLDHTRLYASNANLAFEKSVMTPELFEAVFRVMCRKDMHLLQPNCISIDVLLDAQVHPERHQNLIIKVCGFSARFVSLSKTWQDEVIARHRLK